MGQTAAIGDAGLSGVSAEGGAPLQWSERHIEDVPWVCVDVETTGLEVEEGHRVCEAAAAKGRIGGDVEEFTSLINPERPISADAAAVSGLSEADVAEAPTFAEVAPAIHSLLDGAVIVAHNAPFDAGFLETELGMVSLSLPAAPIIDTTIVAGSLLKLPVRNLPGVARALGLHTQPTHRALDDARATREVLLRGLRRLLDGGARTVGDVVDALLPPLPAAGASAEPLTVTRAALMAGSDIRIAYGGRGGATERIIRPIRLEQYRGRLLLAAYCRTRKAPRTFRVDRIVRASPIDRGR